MNKTTTPLSLAITLIIIWAGSLAAQTWQPTMEYSSMLNIRFYETTGGFLIETLPVFFPPSDLGQLEFEITNGAGEVKYEKGAYAQPFQQLAVVDGIRPQGGGMVSGLPKGRYHFSVKLDGQAITSIPFSIEERKSGDPFNPQTKLTREGPWSGLGYLTASAEKPGEALRFNWWCRVGDLPESKGGKVVLEVYKEDLMIADSKGFFVSKTTWQACSKPLRKADSGGREFFTMADLTAQDGAYRFVLKTGEKTIRIYSAAVVGGKLQHHQRSAMDYEPHTEQLLPKIVSGAAGNGAGQQMLDAYWLDAE